MIRFTMPNGHMWMGKAEEVQNSIGLNAMDKHSIREVLGLLDECNLDISEVHMKNGSKIEVFQTREEIQAEINEAGF